MTTADARTPDTRTRCPRCDTVPAYPAITASPTGPQFTLVCEYCGTHRPYPSAPLIDVDDDDVADTGWAGTPTLPGRAEALGGELLLAGDAAPA